MFGNVCFCCFISVIFRDKLERRYIRLVTEWGEEVSVSIHDYTTFEDIRNAIRNSEYHQMIMDGDPRDGRPRFGDDIIRDYAFAINGNHLPRYCESMTIVCRDSTVRFEIITHSGGDDELILDNRDLVVHIPNPSYVSRMKRVFVLRDDTLVDVRQRLADRITDDMFVGDYVFRIDGSFVAKEEEGECRVRSILHDRVALVPCSVLAAGTEEGMFVSHMLCGKWLNLNWIIFSNIYCIAVELACVLQMWKSNWKELYVVQWKE